MSWACDYDPLVFYREREVAARKEHRCEECSAPILRGERYLSFSGKGEDFFSGGQHLLCRDACVWIRDVLNGECIPFGALREWWDDHRSPSDLWSALGRATVADQEQIDAHWRRGARMFAMVRRRERLAREAA
jgi:hypothetical protein